jgi:hypothetical protein
MKKRFCLCGTRKRTTSSDTGKVNDNLYLRGTFMQTFQFPFHKNSMYLSIFSLNNVSLRESKLNSISSYFQRLCVHLETIKCAYLKAVCLILNDV